MTILFQLLSNTTGIIGIHILQCIASDQRVRLGLQRSPGHIDLVTAGCQKTGVRNTICYISRADILQHRGDRDGLINERVQHAQARD